MQNPIPFKRFGTMVDCSRNAVMTVSALKKWANITNKMGYNTLYLYLEDIYEVEDNPYFGHFRGKFTKEEIKELVEYCDTLNMEVIPCIQTLAHLMNYKRWGKTPYDIDDILLAGDEKVYEFCEKIFKSLNDMFKTKTVNIGMDEAQNLGRGIYADLHGNRDRSTILLEHLNKVSQIAEKYGYTLGMWSDMFYTSFIGETYNENVSFGDEIINSIPKNVDLIYWDYWTRSIEKYDGVMKSHEKLKPGYWFAAGAWTWQGFAPHNKFAMDIIKKAVTACRMNNVSQFMYTMWGDNGGECSRFSAIPTVFYASEIAKGIDDETVIRNHFRDMFNMELDDFLALDMYDALFDTEVCCNKDKYLLYNDPFLGIFDTTIDENESEKWKLALEKLEKAKVADEWQYLFDASKCHAKLMIRKSTLGIKTRKAYENGDKEAISELSKVYKELSNEVYEFYKLFKKRWFKENKGNGFEVQDIRFGGVILRLNHLSEVLEDYANGKLEKIQELEEKQLDFFGDGDNFKKAPLDFRDWQTNATVALL